MEATMLPDGWYTGFDSQADRTYYYNTATRLSQWERPTAANEDNNSTSPSAIGSPVDGGAAAFEAPLLPAGWEELVDDSSWLPYFLHTATGEATWERPCSVALNAATTPPVARQTNLQVEQDRPSVSFCITNAMGLVVDDSVSVDSDEAIEKKSSKNKDEDAQDNTSWWFSTSLGTISSLVSTVSSSLWWSQSRANDKRSEATPPVPPSDWHARAPGPSRRMSFLQGRPEANEASPIPRHDNTVAVEDLFAQSPSEHSGVAHRAQAFLGSAGRTLFHESRAAREATHRIQQNLALPVALVKGMVHKLRFRVGQRVNVEAGKDGVFVPGTVTAIAGQIRKDVHSGFLELQMEDGEYQRVGRCESNSRTRQGQGMSSPVYKYHQVSYCVQLDQGGQVVAPFYDDEREIRRLVGSTVVVDEPAFFGPKRDSDLGQRLEEAFVFESSSGDVSMIMCQLMKPVPIGERSPVLDKRKCSNCGTVSDFLQGCSKCQTAMYCDLQCQASHWSVHKVACHTVAQLRKQDPRLHMAQVGKKQAMKANLSELLRVFLENDCSLPGESAELLRDLILQAEDAVAEYYLSNVYSNAGPFQDLVLEIVQAKEQEAMRIILTVDCFMCLPAGVLHFATSHPTISDWCRTGVALFVQISKSIPLKKYQERRLPLPSQGVCMAMTRTSGQDSLPLGPASSSILPVASRIAPLPSPTIHHQSQLNVTPAQKGSGEFELLSNAPVPTTPCPRVKTKTRQDTPALPKLLVSSRQDTPLPFARHATFLAPSMPRDASLSSAAHSRLELKTQTLATGSKDVHVLPLIQAPKKLQAAVQENSAPNNWQRKAPTHVDDTLLGKRPNESQLSQESPAQNQKKRAVEVGTEKKEEPAKKQKAAPREDQGTPMMDGVESVASNASKKNSKKRKKKGHHQKRNFK